MLIIELKVNGECIQRVKVTQVEKLDKDTEGAHIYLVDGKLQVYHLRKDGILSLAYKALAKLLNKAYY